jgi:methyltransferase type 11
MEVTDYSVSGETFTLTYEERYALYRTTPVPDNLGRYYQSEAYISHTDGKKGLLEKLYQWVKQYTLLKKMDLIRQYIPQGSLLDIGAGTGDFVRMAKQKGWYATGVEPEAKARDRAGEKGVFLYESQEQLDEKYDVITLWHVLEHIANLEGQIRFLKDHLKEDGLLVIAVPNYKSQDAQHYGAYWAAYDVPRHLWHFSQQSIWQLFTEKGFQLIGVKPMYFDAFYVSLLSEKYKTGRMNFLKGFYHGLVSNLSALQTGEYSSLIYLLKIASK